MRGGPRDIRTADPVGHDAPLKYRENLPGECRKWPTENFSRTSCDVDAAHRGQNSPRGRGELESRWGCRFRNVAVDSLNLEVGPNS